MIGHLIAMTVSMKKFLPSVIVESIDVKNERHIRFYVGNSVYLVGGTRGGDRRVFFRRHEMEKHRGVEDVGNQKKKILCDKGSTRVGT